MTDTVPSLRPPDPPDIPPPPPVSPPPANSPIPPALIAGIFALVVVGLGFLGLGVFAVLRLNSPAPAATATLTLASVPTQVVIIPTTTPLPTATATAEPSATSTEAPSTATPTEDSETTPLPTPTEVLDVVTSEVSANVRTGPGTNYPSIGGLQVGESAVVIGRDAGSDWFNIEFEQSTSGQGWIAAIVVSYAGDMGALPIIAAPPPPAATATPRPSSNPAPGPVAGTHGVSGQLTLCSGKLTFAVQERVCFVEWIKNNTAAPVSYGILGVGAVNTGSGAVVFQTSWSAQGVEDGRLWIDPGCIGPTDRCNGQWEDGVRIGSPGTWRLTMQVCFSDYTTCLNGGDWEVLSGAIVVTVN